MINKISALPAWDEPTAEILKIENLFSAYGGEAMDPQNEKAVNELYEQCHVQNKLGKGIGMTELMGASTFTMPGLDMGENDLGVPLQLSNCKIIDTETHKELGYNKEGEVCFAGPCVMLGYYHNKQATEELVRVHKDGIRWIHTGDLGKLDEKGRLHLTGRIKRIIMTKGKDGVITKLFPDRIEKVVNTHEAVSLSCVISVPDEVRVNYPKAFVELNRDNLLRPQAELFGQHAYSGTYFKHSAFGIRSAAFRHFGADIGVYYKILPQIFGKTEAVLCQN